MSLEGNAVGLFCIFPGCMVNQYLLEHIRELVPNPTMLLTMVQYFFISAVSYLLFMFLDGRTLRLFTYFPVPAVPGIWRHLCIAMLKLGSTLIGNLALAIRLPMPLHMVVRSTGTLFTFFIGTYFYGRKYTFLQRLSAWLVTIGVVLCTINIPAPISTRSEKADIPGSVSVIDWLWFFLLHATSLIMLTVAQELKVSRDSKELESCWALLFYHHAPALPLLLILTLNNCRTALGKVIDLYSLGQVGSDLLVSLFLWNPVSQMVCLSGFIFLQRCSSPLGICIWATLRKAASVFLSVLFFGHPWNWAQQFGAALVIGGSVLYHQPRFVSKRL